MNYRKVMLVTFMLLAVLTIGAVSASENVTCDELAVSDEVADVQLPQEDFDDLSMDNFTVIYPPEDEGDEGGDEDPYNVEVAGEFDYTDQDLAILNVTCPADEQKGYFVFKTLNDDWRELYSYTYAIQGSDKGNVIQFTPNDLGITEPGWYIVLVYCAENPNDLQEDEEIFEAYRGIEAIDYSQFRYISLDTFEPNALLMGDVFAVYCPDGSSGKVFVDVRKEDDDEFFQTSQKRVRDKDDENMLYWSLSELEIYGKDGRYSFNVYHQGGNDSSYDDIARDEMEVVSPISIPSYSYINSTIHGELVSVEIPSNFEDGEIMFMINGEEIFTKSLDEFVVEGGNSPYWRYGDGYGGPDENWKVYCIDNYHFAYDFENGRDYVIGAILTLNGQSHYLFTNEVEVRMIERNIVSDGEYSIEIFGDNSYIFEEWTFIIVITAPEDSEGTVEIWADDYDGWSWEGPLGDLSGSTEEEGVYWILPVFFDDLGPGDYVICVAYNDEDGNRVIDNSGYIEFYYDDDDEDGPIEDIELSLNAEDEEEPKFEISDNEVIAYLLIPDNEEFDGTSVTVNVTRNRNDFKTFNTDEMEYEIDDVKKAKKYPIDLDLTQLGDKDLLSIALDCFDEEVWSYGIEIDEDTAIFHWYDEIVGAYVFVGNITTGDFNDPERMGPHPDGRFIELAIPDAFNVSEGSIVVDDGSGTIIERSLDDFEDVQYRYEVLGDAYIISLDDYDLMSLPENRTITFTFNFESDSLTYKRIRHGDYLAQIVTPDDVAKSYDININDEVMKVKEDIAVDIVGIDANPQSIVMDVGEGQFNVYVNDEKVEGLGRLIYDNWLYLSGVLDADAEELRDMDIAENLDMPLEEFAELSREEKIQILNDTFKSDYPDDITLFRLTSFRHGCPELHISLADLNITASGDYNIKVTHIPGDSEEVLDSNYHSIELVETLVLEKDITVAYKPSPFISADPVTTQYGKDVNVTVNLFKDVPGRVSITINGKTEKVPITNGVATFTVSGLKYGLYTVDISYGGNWKYADETITTTLKVNKLTKPIVSVSADDIGFNEDATVIVNVAQKVNGNVHVTVNNVTKAAPIKNGVATATFSGLERGTYEVSALYKGTANIVSKTVTTTFKVVKGTPIISVDAPDAGYGSDAVITVNLGNRANGFVHFTINGVTDKAPITNGIATYSISGLKRGTYDVNVMYKGNTNYNAQNYTTTLNVVKGTPITSISVKNIHVDNDAVVNVKLADNVNGFVKITVNGVTQRVQVVDGQASATFSGLKAGTYEVSAVYAGTANFNAQTKTASFSVSKNAPALRGYKSIVDGKVVIRATIASDAPGNVKLIVGGTTYSAKINNGVALFDPLDIPSGTSVQLTYGGNYKYIAQTKTLTI